MTGRIVEVARRPLACLARTGLQIPLQFDAPPPTGPLRLDLGWFSPGAADPIRAERLDLAAPRRDPERHRMVLAIPHPGLMDGDYLLRLRAAAAGQVVVEASSAVRLASPGAAAPDAMAAAFAMLPHDSPPSPDAGAEETVRQLMLRPARSFEVGVTWEDRAALLALGRGDKTFRAGQVPPLRLTVCTDAWLLDGHLPVTAQGVLVGPAIGPGFPAVATFGWRAAPVLSLDAAIVTLVHGTAAELNYYHFHQDHLAGLLMVEQLRARHPDAVVLLPDYLPWQAEAVGLLAPALGETRCAGSRHVAARRLLVPSLAQSVKRRVDPLLAEALRRVRRAALPAAGGAARVYISRLGAGRRPLLNEEELIAALNVRGFAILDTRGMGYRQQVAALSGARFILGVHGAGLVNIGFAPARALVMEIFNQAYVPPYFVQLAALLGLRYRCFIDLGEGPSRPHDTAGWRLDLARFLPGLDQALEAEGAPPAGPPAA